MSKTNITQVKIESKMLQDKLKEELNVRYEGTDPVKDEIILETEEKKRGCLTDKEIKMKKIESFPF